MVRALLLVSALVACAGGSIPRHNGYRSTKARPWKKFATLQFDEKLEAKTEGELSYRELRRAAWIAVDLPSSGELNLELEANPSSDIVSDTFDLGLEVLDEGYRSLLRKDLEEGEAQQDLVKTATLKDLTSGRYWIHLYLQGRLDAGEYILRAAFKSGTVTEGKSDFPAQVANIGPLPLVPITDDTPQTYRSPPVVSKKRRKSPPRPPPPPPAVPMSARIIRVSVVTGGTQITVGRGTTGGAAAGMRGKVEGLANGGFVLAGCEERTCTATLQGITPDMLKGSGRVSLSP